MSPVESPVAGAAPPDDLEREVALLHEVIDRLHPRRRASPEQLRQMAELRHQIVALCTLLRTRRLLATESRGAVAGLEAEIRRLLEELDREEEEAAR